MSDSVSQADYFVSWSGGKDSCLAMGRVARDRGKPARLFTMLDETGKRSRGHHLRPGVLEAQAEALGVPLEVRKATWDGYEDLFLGALRQMRDEGVAEGVFGDIDLAGHLEWVERVCAQAGMTAREPLWLEERMSLLNEFLDRGYVAVIVGVKEGTLDTGLLGRTMDRSLVEELVAAGIDASGELGEYHTVVVDGPGFLHPVEVAPCGHISYDGYRFLDLVPAG